MPSCSFCSTEGAPLRCTKCRIAHYCDAECQRKAWKQGHKIECQAAATSPPHCGRQWVLYVDYLTPSSLAVLAVSRKLSVPLQALRVQEQCAKLRDEDRLRTEWDKEEAEEIVPRLEGAGLVLTAPQAIVRALLDLWGEGRLEPGAQVPFAQRAKFGEVLIDVWPRLIAPISLHLFRTIWDSNENDACFSTLVDLAKAFRWMDQTLVPVAQQARDQGRPSVLDYVAGGALTLLFHMGSFVLVDSLQNLPTLRAWMRDMLQVPSLFLAIPDLKTKANTEQHEAYLCPGGTLQFVARKRMDNPPSNMNSDDWVQTRGFWEPKPRGPAKWPYEDDTIRKKPEMDYEEYTVSGAGFGP